jgi:serine/threonine protein kinase
MSASKNIEIKNPTGGASTSANVQIPNRKEGGPKTSRAGFFLKYELRETVGVGSTSTCHRCTRKSDGVEFACKVIDKQQIDEKFTGLLDQFYIEIKALQSLEHRNIISLVDVFETSAKIYMVMEMMNGGELFDYVVEKGTLSEEEASLFVRKITSAVAHMHNLGIIHRDLKPENLLLTSKDKSAEVKLIDFGLAKIVVDPSGAASSFLGTKGYLAPEMLQRNGYDKAIDMWALGIIVFVLLCGCLPFDDDSSKIPSESAARKKFTLRFPRWSTNLSASAKDLLHNLLDVNPKTRYTAEQALNHPWVSGKTVVPNNYLQSPSILGERRRETKTPATPQMESQHNKLMMANSVTATSHMPTSGYGNGNGNAPGGRKQSRDDGNSGGGLVRKNSL